MMRLAERCAGQGCVELTLKVFMAMSEHRLSIKPGFAWPDDEGRRNAAAGWTRNVSCAPITGLLMKYGRST